MFSAVSAFNREAALLSLHVEWTTRRAGSAELNHPDAQFLPLLLPGNGAGRSLMPSRPVHLDGKQQPRILGQRWILEYNQTRKREGGRKTELRNKSRMRTRRKNSSAERRGGRNGGEAVGGPPPLGRRHCCANHSRRLALLRDPRLLLCTQSHAFSAAPTSRTSL